MHKPLEHCNDSIKSFCECPFIPTPTQIYLQMCDEKKVIKCYAWLGKPAEPSKDTIAIFTIRPKSSVIYAEYDRDLNTIIVSK